MMSRVLVVGSINMDLIVAAPRLPQRGETVIGASFSTAAGGKGANQAVAAARQGAQVAMIGRIGDDEFGHRVRSELAQSGVDVAHIKVDPDLPTATGHILIDGDGHNAIVVASGANSAVDAHDVLAADSGWQGAQLVVLQLEIPLAANRAAVEAARQRRLPVILNAAPMDTTAKEVIEAADYLIINEVEAEQLAGEHIASAEDALDLAHALQRPGQIVVLTLGALGAVLVSADGGLHQAAPHVAVVDTTAAGDAFVGAFAAALSRGTASREALRLAVAAGSLACTRLGAIPSLPGDAEVRDLVASLS